MDFLAVQQQMQHMHQYNQQRAAMMRQMMQQRAQMMYPGGCGGGYQGNFSGVYTGNTRASWRCNGYGGGRWHVTPTQGYGLDLNRNGRFDRGRDGVLVFDTNRDGRYDDRDVKNTSNMMRAVTGDVDFNNDGYRSASERVQGAMLRSQYARLDRNRDGVLDTREIAGAGGKVWVDHSRGGSITRNELYSPFRIPNAAGWGPSQRLDAVNPFARASHTSNNWGWNAPCYGPVGGYGYYGQGYY